MQKINNKKIILTVITIVSIIIIYKLFTKEDSYIENIKENNNIEINQENSISTKEENKSQKIIIHITGQVKNEGIYELEENSRIADCIEKAGGLTNEANIKEINLAYILEDGMKIYIPKIKEDYKNVDNTDAYVSKENSDIDNSDKNINTSKSTSKTTKININTASQTELETLPGIGTSTALKIINYRKENGKFNNIEDIKKVSGIGDSKFSKIKDLIKTM